jgi:hypothetical protein
MALLLGLASIFSTVWAVVGIVDPIGGGSDSPESIRYFRLISFLFAFGIFLGASAMRISDKSSHGARMIGLVIGTLGVIAGGAALLTLIGLCGPQVVWWGCSP